MRFRRLSAFVLSIAVLLSSMMPVYATSRGVDDAVINHVVVPFERMVTTSVESIGRMLDSVQDESFQLIRNCYEFWSGLISEAVLDYGGFVDDLDYTTITSGGLFTITPTVKWEISGVEADIFNNSDLISIPGGWSFSGYAFGTQTSYSNGSFGCNSTDTFYVPPGLYNIRTDRSGYWGDERYTPYSMLILLDLDGDQAYKGSGSTNVGLLDGYYTASSLFVKYSYYVKGGWYEGTYYDVGSTFELECVDLYDGVEITTPDVDSRTSSLMQTIHTYNTNNSYVDNSSNVNFFIVPSGDEPSADTAISPSIYDEETLVYTDPVTGTQYLTNGWTYDYLTRCYTLDMADESYKIGDTVIDTIKLTYGDELLTVDHYSGGSLIQSDKYNYVMMSGSACAIDGHTYNVETTKEPTCTAAGERTYTCSVCGNQYVEEITKTDHAYGNYEIVQEATCTAPGIASYTCTTCGGQYTDTISALGHDWQPTAATEEAYVMPDNVSCPECAGDLFTYIRSDLDIRYGKNLFDLSKITVQSPSDTFPWVSEVGTDYIVVSVPENCSKSHTDLSVTWSDLVSNLVPGLTYTFSCSVDSGAFRGLYAPFLSDSVLDKGESFTIPDSYLSSSVFLYGLFPDESGIIRISNFQIELGSKATEYEPYDSEYVEIIPPIYTFTCSDQDCGAVWTEEAEYQGATVTYTCTRCHETRTEASGEEAGLFHSIGNLIADGITWATDKLTELVENLSGINKTFNDYANSIRENTGQFPAFLGAILALMPEDFMNVIWLGVVALVALAVWKKWFS